MRAFHLAIAAVVAIHICADRSWTQEPVSLERTLVRVAPKILKHLDSEGFRNVGVLKFLVHKDGQPQFTHTAGTLNLMVARQLELALIVANDPRKPLGIVENASDTASKIDGANHLTSEGRRKLFEQPYPLAWGDKTVEVDAFVAGLIGISDDLRTLKLSFMVVDRANGKLTPLDLDVEALNSSSRLSEIGESFATRGFFDGGRLDDSTKPPKSKDDTFTTAVEVGQGKAKHPLQGSLPIGFQVLYDDRPVAIEFRDGKAFLPEPNEGQKVEFVLARNAKEGRLGIAVKVNGENTLYRDRKPDLHGRKWVSDPGDGPIRIRGYQLDKDQIEKFRVLSNAESLAREMDYGTDVGTITVSVFGERGGKRPTPDLSDEARDSLVVERMDRPEKKPGSFDALKAQLFASADRGLIAQGERIGGSVRLVKFEPDPQPLYVATIVYFRK